MKYLIWIIQKINQETLPKALQKDDMFIAKPIIAAK